MANTLPGDTLGSALPTKSLPKYESIKDLRLLGKAFRQGWVAGVSKERQGEWMGDIAEALKDDKKFHAAARTLLAVGRHLNNLELARLEGVYPHPKRRRGRPRKHPKPEST